MKNGHRAISVALIGADGTGKSTISRRVVETLGLPAKHVYMGVNLESSNLLLPTTRLLLEAKRLRGRRPDAVGPPRSQPQQSGGGVVRRAVGGVKSALRLLNWAAEEWFRQVVVWWHQRRGYVVVLDRHFYADYYRHGIANGEDVPLASRLHGAMLERYYPKPDLFILLDAPAEVLFDRKGEGTLGLLAERQQEYREMCGALGNCEVVSVEQPLDDVVAQIAAMIRDTASRGVSPVTPQLESSGLE